MVHGSGMAGVALALLLGGSSTDASDTVRAALEDRLPKTEVSAVDCSRIHGLCEVVAGENLFYVDRTARYLVIGRVYDMQTRQDLTAARLLELNPDMLVGGATKANAATGEAAHAGTGALPAAPATAPHLDLSGLSDKGAIRWGKGGPAVTIFTDFRCGYCRALTSALATMHVTVIERPISVLGSRGIANQVLCARDRERAVRAAYAREPVDSSGACDTSGLDENEAFARRHGLSGTPVIVRSDGAVLEGYRPKEQLSAWLKGAKS